MHLNHASQRAQVDAWGVINMFKNLHDQLDLFGKWLIFLWIHSVLVDKVDHHNLTWQHCLFSLLFLPFTLLFLIFFVLLDLLLGHRLHYFLYFVFLSSSALVISLFSVFFAIEKLLQSFPFLSLPLGFGLVTLTFLPLVVDELFRPLWEDVQEGVLRHLPLVFLFHQLYKIWISFIKESTKGSGMRVQEKLWWLRPHI